MSSSPKAGFFELRQYELHPQHMKTYLDETSKAAPFRSAIFDTAGSRWLAFFGPEIGGHLNKVHHLYWYQDHDVRDVARTKAATTKEWGDYLKLARPCMVKQENMAFIEATAVLQAAGLGGARDFAVAPDTSGKVAYELRTHQLPPGYDAVPRFLDLYAAGLPDKLRAAPPGASALVTLLHS
eukprot:CAMPEP_0113675296 /NCGR_PEP_ID=MMETSP0038_2-20120614/7931_1 /TAXON_ID=2898 /ORGANISM="Cryptomonas paramecium" /LENGTH=181 /DNA_ID=CAMNT_0000592043 /DNA_START=107 /DNA_END=649 /DNA_ORIENTATION=+ /assembly_acc=CAM_ASM_000170